MAQFKLIDGASKEISTTLLVKDISTQAIFDAVIAENAGQRQGTHSTLTKAEVRGGGKKPRPQKHSGRARQGSTRSPQWRGGGVVFGPKPTRNYKIRLNYLIKQNAFASAFSQKYNEDAILILNKGHFAKPSTKEARELLAKLNFTGIKTLIICDCKNTQKSFLNIDKVMVKSPKAVSTRDIINSKKIIICEDAFDILNMKGGNK